MTTTDETTDREALIALMERLGYSPVQVAAAVSTTAATVRRYLHGDRAVSPQVLRALEQHELLVRHGIVERVQAPRMGRPSKK